MTVVMSPICLVWYTKRNSSATGKVRSTRAVEEVRKSTEVNVMERQVDPDVREQKPATKKRAPRNRTLVLSDADRNRLIPKLLEQRELSSLQPMDGVICGDCMELASDLPKASVDLLILDSPYNLSRKFGTRAFRKQPIEEYTLWLEKVVLAFLPVLKPNATVYICGDWLTSISIFEIANRHLFVRNRITWEREKGRGAKQNWKNNSEDIWFCTVGQEFTFHVEDVRHRRRVIAPYRNKAGLPKDWQESAEGNYRDTFPSNLWTDISIPFWSMPENTDHPTQKSEKLLAKLILASSAKGDLVLDPFAGSGSTCVAAQKLGRRFLGIEREMEYALLALRRLELAQDQPTIQGYHDGVFWPRNTTK